MRGENSYLKIVDAVMPQCYRSSWKWEHNCNPTQRAPNDS